MKSDNFKILLNLDFKFWMLILIIITFFRWKAAVEGKNFSSGCSQTLQKNCNKNYIKYSIIHMKINLQKPPDQIKWNQRLVYKLLKLIQMYIKINRTLPNPAIYWHQNDKSLHAVILTLKWPDPAWKEWQINCQNLPILGHIDILASKLPIPFKFWHQTDQTYKTLKWPKPANTLCSLIMT